MSQAVTQDGPDREINKTVTLIGYLKDQDETPREWADRFDEDKDYFDSYAREYERTDYFLRGGGVEIELDEELYEALSEVDVGGLNLVANKYVEENSGFYNYPREAAGKLFREVAGDWFDHVAHVLDLEVSWGNKMEDDDGNTVVRVYRYADTMGLLKHQSEITGEDDMWEDEDEVYPAVKYKIKVIQVNQGQLDVIDSEFITPFTDALAKHPEIGRVRIMDCEQETKEKGVCLVV